MLVKQSVKGLFQGLSCLSFVDVWRDFDPGLLADLLHLLHRFALLLGSCITSPDLMMSSSH